MLQQPPLHRRGGQVGAASDDDQLPPRHEPQEAVRVEARKVAGAEPTWGWGRGGLSWGKVEMCGDRYRNIIFIYIYIYIYIKYKYKYIFMNTVLYMYNSVYRFGMTGLSICQDMSFRIWCN